MTLPLFNSRQNAPHPDDTAADRPPYRLLLVNDDGIDAPGLVAMEAAMKTQFEHYHHPVEIFVAAPAHEQSAVAHGISLYRELKIEKRSPHHFAVYGTPADCVKVAVSHLWTDRKPDLVVSGINRGQNVGTCVLYSGTVAAAMEAAMMGIPAVAVSLAFLDIFTVDEMSEDRPALFDQLGKLARHPEDYDFAARIGAGVAQRAMDRTLPRGVALNVNVPYLPEDEIQGLRVCAMSDAWFNDEFKQGESGLWRNIGSVLTPGTGDFVQDDRVLEHHRSVSVTPLHFDLTAHRFLPMLESWFRE